MVQGETQNHCLTKTLSDAAAEPDQIGYREILTPRRSPMSSEDTTVYKVVVNHEEQYSIWPAYRENALGWKDAGKSGSKEECLDYIKQVWTDMRPLSLRKKMEEDERKGS